MQAKWTKKGTDVTPCGIAGSPSERESTRTWAYRLPFAGISTPRPAARRTTGQILSGWRKRIFKSCRIVLESALSGDRDKLACRDRPSTRGSGIEPVKRLAKALTGHIPARLATNHTSSRRPARPAVLFLKSTRSRVPPRWRFPSPPMFQPEQRPHLVS